MDVGLAEIDGVPLSFMTGVGYAHPAYYSGHESDWLQTFPGGLFVTGGLDTYGQPASDEGADVRAARPGDLAGGARPLLGRRLGRRRVRPAGAGAR